MAQLRDKHTSEVVFEGTPLEVSTLAKEIGFDEVLFDDVGEGFDPAVVIKTYNDDAKGLEAVGSDAAKDRAKAIRDTIAAAKKAKTGAMKKIERARDAREKARA